MIQMKLYHYPYGAEQMSQRAVYEVEKPTSVEAVFGSINNRPGVKLVSIPCGKPSQMDSFDPSI